MEEQQIANQLKQNLPQPTEAQPIAPKPQLGVGQAEQAMPLELDEMTVYKLHEFFGERYDSTDEKSKEQVTYVYEKIGEIIGEQDYGLIIEKARDLELLIGVAHDENRMYKLYKWLKLDSMRRSVEAQQNALRSY